MVYKQRSDSSISSFNVISDEGCCSTRNSSDYQILNETIERKKAFVRQARLELGIDLHRLGEHHVRNLEYHEAMNVFVEALVEKRAGTGLESHEQGALASASSRSSSLYGSDLGQRKEVRGLEEVIATLSSIGSVHSVTGEYSEAMKCYSQIMTMRSSFSTLPRLHKNIIPENDNNNSNGDADVDVYESSDRNEDVNALDDIFRQMSFRNSERKDEERGKSSPKHVNLINENEEEMNGQEVETVHFEKFGPWSQLDDAVQEFKVLLETNSKTGTIDCRLMTKDYKYVTSQIDALKEEYRHNIELQENTESMREKCLYMSLLVHDMTLKAQKAIADYYLTQKAISYTKEHEENFIETSKAVAATMIVIGRIHYKLYNVNEELHMYKQALSTYQNALGDSHPFVAGTRKNIGMVLTERIDFDGAMKQFELAKEIYEKCSGSCVTGDVASAILCMGNIKYRQGELDVALSMYSKALCIYRTLGEDVGWSQVNVSNVTSTLKIIGMAYTTRSDWESAMKCYQEAMELLNSLDMAKGLEAASLFTRMGGFFYKKGQYEKAMEQYDYAYKVSLEALGSKYHPDVAGIVHSIGIVHQMRSEFNDAIRCYEECIQIYRNTLGPDNPKKAGPTVYLGSIHYRQGRYDKAMSCYKEALRLYETSYGINHPQVAPTMKSIAMIHTKKEEYDEAMEIFQDLLRMKCVSLGSNHPDIAYAHKCIGNVHVKQGEMVNAITQYKHAYDMYHRILGDDHETTKSMKNNMAAVRQNLMIQQRAQERREGVGYDDRRRYKRRNISASKYAY
mmetsp:Transcript_18268/g.22363  ORF Transcript_18268/g.22363 Transcript_18268/m.22363 type:complete len:793 (+) Transcript_18268:81-2459(+)